jgi:hypothetical protein
MIAEWTGGCKAGQEALSPLIRRDSVGSPKPDPGGAVPSLDPGVGVCKPILDTGPDRPPVEHRALSYGTLTLVLSPELVMVKVPAVATGV